MGLNNLRIPEGSRKKRKRVGRGAGSGIGKTAGKGSKGQNARSGGGTPLWFEGGQMPLQRRLPKRGFKNPNRKVWAILNIGDLAEFSDENEITPELLRKAGKFPRKCHGIKILGNGEIDRAVVVKADRFSENARKKIEDAGGKVEVI